jgi:transposase-like protein
MISWELPHDDATCPHCGSADTTLQLQLLGLVRFTCNRCRKSFALQAGKASPAKPSTAEPHQA